MVLGWQRRDGRRPRPGMGCASGRRTARDDLLSRRRRLGVRGEEAQEVAAGQEEETVAKERHELKLGKGATFFVKSRLKRLPQEDETWEADFRALPQAITQSATHYLGMVLTQPHGFFLAELEVERKPTVNDLATLLAHAMQRPIVEGSHRPRRIHLRGHPQWQELFPHLKEIGIEVAVRSELPKVAEAYREHLQDVSEVPVCWEGEAVRRATERREAVPGHRPMGSRRAHR